MEALIKKLKGLKAAFNQIRPTTKSTTPKTAKVKISAPKLPGMTPSSQKDPVKMAEQTYNPDVKPIAMEGAKQTKEALKISKSGQWNLTSE